MSKWSAEETERIYKYGLCMACGEPRDVEFAREDDGSLSLRMICTPECVTDPRHKG